jgi:4'-phosphopantetheinyl transferase EntD
MKAMETIACPFDSDFGFAVRTPAEVDPGALRPEEACLLSEKAVFKRRLEFAMGRAAAHAALAAIGRDAPILRGRNNEPLWPPGVVGAISHTESIAVAAAALRSKTEGIGLDVESTARDVSLGITRLVCLPEEREWVEQSEEGRRARLISLFSAKESVFKAFFPIERVYLEFRDARLTPLPDGSFSGRLLKRASARHPEGFEFAVRCRKYENHSFTYLSLPPPESA